MSSFEQMPFLSQNLPLFASPSSIIVSASTVIPLKTQLAYKILERGRMRFWLQAEHISSAVTYKFFANNKELSANDVRVTSLFLSSLNWHIVFVQNVSKMVPYSLVHFWHPFLI